MTRAKPFSRAEKIYGNYNQFRAVITHDGIVHWEPGGEYLVELHLTKDRTTLQLKRV